MNRDVCEHFNPVDLPCAKCEQTPTLREAAQQALEAMSSFESGTGGLYEGEFSAEIAALRAALAEPVQEPVAWYHVPHPGNGISPVVSMFQQREPSLYAVSVPLFTAPPQRKPLTEEQADRAYQEIWRDSPDDFGRTASEWIEAGIRYAERVHGIGEQK